MSIKASEQLQELLGTRLSLGDVIRSLRVCDELSQEVFAKKLGVSKQYLSAVENGKKVVSIDQAANFAKKLGQFEQVFVKYALQDMLDRSQSGAHYSIELHDLDKAA